MKSILAVLVLGLAAQAYAQTESAPSRFYAGLTGGWNHSGAAESYLYQVTQDDPAGTSTQEYRKRSYGSGITAGAFAGYQLIGNVYGELAVSQLFGATYHYGILHIHNSGDVDNSEFTSYVNTLRFAPSLVYAFTKGEEGRRLQTYLRIGLVMNAMPRLYQHYEETHSNVNLSTVTRDEEYSGGFAIGTTGAIGLRRLSGTHWILGAEAVAVMQHWAPTHSETTSFKIDGEERVQTLNTQQRETDYEYEVVYGGPQNPDQPSKQLRLRYPMSSIGGVINVAYRF